VKARASRNDRRTAQATEISDAKVIRILKRNERAALSAVAEKLNVNYIESDRNGKVWKAWSGDRLVARWHEETLPGLGRWIFELLYDYMSLAIPANMRIASSSKGGKKAVEKKRRSGASLSDRILKALATEPMADTASLAERFQCDPSLVRRLRRRQANESLKRD
jgi:hypothetical protein